jgi:hypothetical protein
MVTCLACLFLIFSAFRLVGISRNSLFAGQELYHDGYKKYSGEYLDAIQQLVKDKEHQPGGYIGDSAYYEKMYYSKRLPDFYFPGSSYFIFGISNDSYQYCLSDTSAIYFGYNGTDRDKKFLHQAVHASLFHRDFYSENVLSQGEKRKAAIEKYHLGYIILTRGVQPDKEWESLIEKKFTDKNSGEAFVALRQE